MALYPSVLKCVFLTVINFIHLLYHNIAFNLVSILVLSAGLVMSFPAFSFLQYRTQLGAMLHVVSFGPEQFLQLFLFFYNTDGFEEYSTPCHFFRKEKFLVFVFV